MAADPKTSAPAPTPLHRIPKKLLVPGIAILAIAIIAAGWWYREANKPTASQQETAAALDAAGTVDDKAAIAVLKTAYDDAATQEGKAEAAYFLAARYSAIDDHHNALKYYQEADRLNSGKNIDVILGIANEADALDNKELARTYYQKAIAFYKSESSVANEDIIIRLEYELSRL